MGQEEQRYRVSRKGTLGSAFYCETCNIVATDADRDEVEYHRTMLRHHVTRNVLIVRCARCGETTPNIYSEYSPERNEFWCGRCVAEAGYDTFRSPG